MFMSRRAPTEDRIAGFPSEALAIIAGMLDGIKSKTTEPMVLEANDDNVARSVTSTTKPHKKKERKAAGASASTDNENSPEHITNSGSSNLRTEKKSKHAKKATLAPPSDKPKKARYFEVDGDVSPATAETAKSKEGKKSKKPKESVGTDEKAEGKKRRKKEPKGLQIFE